MLRKSAAAQRHSDASTTQRRGAREWHDLPLKLASIEVDDTKAKSGAFTFKGYGSVWDRVDSYGDTMLKGAFSESINKRRPMMFFGHNSQRVPGKWIEFKEDDHGLYLVGELTPNHSEATDLEASLRHQSIDGLSVGGYTTKADWVEEEGMIIGRKIHTFDLYETSVVSLPAEAEARIDSTSVKQMLDECDTLAELEELLREVAGCSKSIATAFVARTRRIARGEPAASEVESKTRGAGELLDVMRGLTIPQSLLGG